MTLYLDGREAECVLIIERHHCDSFIESGYWLDTDQELTDDELDRIQHFNADEICQACMEEAGTWMD